MSRSSYSGKVFATLGHKLTKLDRTKREKGLLTSDVHFTRKARKLDFREDMKILMSIGASSLNKELLSYFDHDPDCVSLPGFIKSRSKIREEAFIELLDMMNKAYPCDRTYKGYRLMAVDGSQLTVSKNSSDPDSFRPNGAESEGTYLLVMNALYDILNHRYLDNVIQPIKKMKEIGAMRMMIGRYKEGKAIFIADRNYPSWNIMEHVRHKGHKFLIRIKDIDSGASPLNTLKTLPKDGEFDEDVHITFTNRQTKFILNNPERYKRIMTNQTFDFLDKDHNFYDADYRVVRIKIDGEGEEHESLITNLDRDEFSKEDIRKLYKLRWDIEVSYRHLKYSVSLNALHSKRRDFLRQEIWARMIMFNISMIIIDYIQDKKLERKKRKWEYRVNISMAIFIIRGYMAKGKGGHPPDLESLIARWILPVRPNRHYARNVMAQGFVSFGYRFN